ncbi:MAG: ribosome small subunit-dependent GTPase A [Bacillota bacterium]
MQGIIVKGVGGFYTVEAQDGALHVCRARGRFRSEGVKPLAGDEVEFTPATDASEGRIDAIGERRNAWTRPPVANIDKLVIVLSAHWPRPDLLLCDKLLINAMRKDVPAVVCVNKCDVAQAEAVRAIKEEYAHCGQPVICTSAQTGAGLDALRSELSGCVAGLAGQSGVGKSSLLNALVPGLNLETGGRAARTERGKHTTRHVELLKLPGGGRVVDTPGFSLLELDDMLPGDLGAYYPEFSPHGSRCACKACLHDKEPDCGVKAAVEDGKIPLGRYERYKEILHILLESRRKRYD